MHESKQHRDEKPCMFCGSPRHGGGAHQRLERLIRKTEPLVMWRALPAASTEQWEEISLHIVAPEEAQQIAHSYDAPAIVRRFELEGRKVTVLTLEHPEEPQD